jgi:hypothetical protein
VRTNAVDKLLEQHCYKSVVGMLQLVPRVYMRKQSTTCSQISGHILNIKFHTFGIIRGRSCLDSTRTSRARFMLRLTSCLCRWDIGGLHGGLGRRRI